MQEPQKITKKEGNTGPLRKPMIQNCVNEKSNINSAPEKEKSINYGFCMFFVLFVLSLMGLMNQSIAGIGLMMYFMCESLNGLVSFGVAIAIAYLYFTRKMVDGLMATVCWIICEYLVNYFFPKKCKCCGKDDNNCICDNNCSCEKHFKVMKHLQKRYYAQWSLNNQINK